MPTVLGAIVTSSKAAIRDHSSAWTSGGPFWDSWCCGIPALTWGGSPFLVESRPPGTVGHAASSPSGIGFSPWARR